MVLNSLLDCKLVSETRAYFGSCANLLPIVLCSSGLLRNLYLGTFY